MGKGVRVEAHDFVADKQSGLDTAYNEFCEDEAVLVNYGDPYWLD